MIFLVKLFFVVFVVVLIWKLCFVYCDVFKLMNDIVCFNWVVIKLWGIGCFDLNVNSGLELCLNLVVNVFKVWIG